MISSSVVRPRHHGGFEHVGVRAERALDLERRDVDAADLEHVVAPAAVDVIAVLVLDVFVAGARPFAEEGGARLLAVVPVHDGAGRPAHLQLAHLAARVDHLAVVVDDAHVVAGHGLAGGAVFHVAGTVGQEDVQHLGRAEAVEDVDAVALRQRRPMSGGSASPAETQRRSFSSSRASARPGSPGRPHRRSAPRRSTSPDDCLRIVATASGVGRSGSSTVVAPTESGNVIALPSP